MTPFLETSVLVRYLMGSPPEMAARAVQIIDREPTLQVTDVILAEVAHVLMSFYHIPREAVVDRLIEFLQKENIELHGMDRDTAILGLMMCRPSGRVSIPDALIWASARSTGATIVYSFDGRFPSTGIEVRDR